MHNYSKLVNLMKEEGGNSGAFIFLTNDKKFIIKTISNEEKKFFISHMLDKYLERVAQKSKTRLARIFGVFKIYPMKQSVIIMENIIPYKDRCINFDLKGSKVARFVHGIENPLDPPLGCLLKDENFLIFDQKINVDEKTKEKMIKNLIKDFSMLRDAGVMDYSLLLAFHKANENEAKLNRFSVNTADGLAVSIGIIDFFQQYNLNKKTEKNFKSIFNKKQDISSTDPQEYFERISRFVGNIFV